MGWLDLQAGISKFTSCTWSYLNDNEPAHVASWKMLTSAMWARALYLTQLKFRPSSLSPELRKPYRTLLGVLPGVESLPEAPGSDLRAASSCLLLLPSVGPRCASRSFQVNIQVMGMPAKVDLSARALYPVLSKSLFMTWPPFLSGNLESILQSWLTFKVMSPRVSCNRTHHLWVAGLPPPWMMCGEQPWDVLTRQPFWASPVSLSSFTPWKTKGLQGKFCLITIKSLPFNKVKIYSPWPVFIFQYVFRLEPFLNLSLVFKRALLISCH